MDIRTHSLPTVRQVTDYLTNWAMGTCRGIAKISFIYIILTMTWHSKVVELFTPNSLSRNCIPSIVFLFSVKFKLRKDASRHQKLHIRQTSHQRGFSAKSRFITHLQELLYHRWEPCSDKSLPSSHQAYDSNCNWCYHFRVKQGSNDWFVV